ncbi:polysaccharide deacetylase family protein, partial [Nonomuraea turkmeniaca]
PTVIAINYHRIGATDPRNPFHRLHTVPAAVFAQQVDWMQQHGAIVSPDQVRDGHGLAETNFVICFDDVPVSAEAGIDLVRGRGLPVTLSPCGRLAEDGIGGRDKVYAIETFAAPETVTAHVAAHAPAHLADVPFYHLTKRADLDPAWVRQHIIDPLYETVEARARPYLGQRGYLPWEQLRHLDGDRLVTIANHSLTHDNLAALTRPALQQEIDRSHELFTSRMGRPARYFTVPFGRFTQHLAVDLLHVLADIGYAGILWVGTGGLHLTGRYRHQLLHLPRLHAATTIDAFADQVRHAIGTSTQALIWQTPATTHRRAVQLTSSSDPRPTLVAEMVLRQGKDYASDPAFYRHQFTDNPYRHQRPDFSTIECDGRIEAIAYHFHTLFAFGSALVPGVYLSGWRKLPHAHPAAAGHLLNTLLAREAIVGVYRPNPDIHAAFTGWQRARVHQLTLLVPESPARLQAPFRARTSAAFPTGLQPLCAASVRRAGFTVARDSAAYHLWRHSSYPLAQATYLAVYRAGEPMALAVILHRPDHSDQPDHPGHPGDAVPAEAHMAAGCGELVDVADFHIADEHAMRPLITAVLACAARLKARTVTWQTSDPAVIALAEGDFGAASVPFDNFYHFNAALLTSHAGAGQAGSRWSSLPLHETGTTSDVLLR